ncbi:MAG: PHP domain-containing protein [Spirochaetales bacterium]|jgi:PHP family Zn ribbon phosphoesterase|nr:PHP domain-containing protein [Spirochaetales bacterium]
MKQVTADLHNHSCLSPCASLEMSPLALVREAKKQGIDILALTDHNSTRNLPAFLSCCRQHEIQPVFGLEVTTIEEVHIVCLFESLVSAQQFGDFVEKLLPDIPNMPDLFGDQVIVDARENVLGFVAISLLSASSLSFEDVIEEVLSRDGLVIPAHIDRMAFSAVSQLGFLPDLSYSAVEVVQFPCRYPTHDNTLITNSDAHYLEAVGRRSFSYSAADTSYQALREALYGNRVTINQKA